MDATALNGFDRRCLDGRMRRQAEVVLRCKVDAVHSVALVVLRRANGLGTVLRGARKRPETVTPAQILPAKEAFSASQQVRPAWNAEIPHAAGQGGRRSVAV